MGKPGLWSRSSTFFFGDHESDIIGHKPCFIQEAPPISNSTLGLPGLLQSDSKITFLGPYPDSILRGKWPAVASPYPSHLTSGPLPQGFTAPFTCLYPLWRTTHPVCPSPGTSQYSTEQRPRASRGKAPSTMGEDSPLGPGDP